MTLRERRLFLAHGTRTAKLATVRADGRSHAAPVWFALDDEDLVFMTWHASVKGKAIQRDNRVALVIDDENYPYAFVLAEGTASFVCDGTSRQHWPERSRAGTSQPIKATTMRPATPYSPNLASG